MDSLDLTIVEAYRYTGSDINLTTEDAWQFALDQRCFGLHQLLVVTAPDDGVVIGLAHCEQTDPPELALQCCLDTLDDGAAIAIAYNDEPVTLGPPPDVRERFDAARAAATESGVDLLDWIACDDINIRSSRITLQTLDIGPDSPRDIHCGRPTTKRRTRRTRRTRR